MTTAGAADGGMYRKERARFLAALTRVFGVQNLALAEDVVQETLASAFEAWSYTGVPDHASAALMTAAKNRALDVFRRQRTARKVAPELQRLIESEWTLRPTVEELFLPHALADDELRMMFSCCHPDLAEETRVALVLNVLCGFGTEEIARIYLASHAALEKRVSRGKAVLRSTRGLFDLTNHDVAARLASVQRALYLLFSAGYHGACEEAVVREELCSQAIRLARLLLGCAEAASPATFALSALTALNVARLPARIDELGELTGLLDRDRARWDARSIAEGLALLEAASVGTELTDYHLEAAIAGLHASAPRFEEARWDEIVHLYDLLLALRPSPVVALTGNRGRGIGRATPSFIEEHLRAAGVGEYELQVVRENAAAKAFYTAAGFEARDRIPLSKRVPSRRAASASETTRLPGRRGVDTDDHLSPTPGDHVSRGG